MTLQQLTILVLQTSILLMVFSFGLRASGEDILYLARRPALLVRSLTAMFVIMPLVAVAIVRTFELRPSVEIALVALVISPIPPLLPSKGGKAGGHASYGLGLMTIVALLSVIIVPLGVRILGAVFKQPFAISAGAIAGLALQTTILPLAAGMAVRGVLPAAAERMAHPAGLIAKVLLAAGILAVLAAVYPAVFALIGNGTILAMAAFVTAGLAVGHLLGGPRSDERVVLALSVASRHPAIALTVARVNFPDEPYLGATILLYLLVGAVVGLPYMAWQRRRVQEIASEV